MNSSLATSFVELDDGRLRLHRDWLPLFEALGLTRFDAWFGCERGALVRAVKQRRTTRISLEGHEPLTVYLKRHQPLPIREYVRSALKLNWPSNGARPEWEALLAFYDAGIRTALPLAFGEHNGRSLLATRALEGFVSLRDVVNKTTVDLRTLVLEMANVARRMHAAGLCHQDFYFDHLLIPESTLRQGHAGTLSNALHVIDLGRVRSGGWSSRWRLKDLAQMLYSMRDLDAELRTLFLETYLGRHLSLSDAAWLAIVGVKSWWIAHHTRRRSL